MTSDPNRAHPPSQSVAGASPQLPTTWGPADPWEGIMVRLRRVRGDVVDEVDYQKGSPEFLRRTQVVNGPPGKDVELGVDQRNALAAELQSQLDGNPDSFDAEIVMAFIVQLKMSIPSG